MSRSGRAPVWRIVAEREVRTKMRDKAFLGSTAFTLVFVIGLLVFGAISGANANQYDVALGPGVDPALAQGAEQWLKAATDSDDPEITVAEASDVESAVRDGDADAGLVLVGERYEIVGDEGVDEALRAALSAAVRDHVVQANAAASGTDLAALLAGSETEVRLLDPNAEESGARSGIAFAFALVFFMTALTFGMTIAQSVAQEKESRIVEILAAAVPIRSLLWGKIAGNTVLALGQVLLLAVVGIVGLAVIGERDLLAGVGLAVVWYVAFFLLGFVALACLWAVAGSLASRQEDLQSTTLPGQLILLVPYLAAVLGGDQVRTVLSMLPIVSTMIMPGRLAEGSVPWWQIAIAIGLTVVAAVVFVRVGSRLYERTLLRTGGKLGYRQALREPADR